MRDAKRSESYAAEQAAFDDTLVNERPGFGSLVQDSQTLVDSVYWRSAGLPTNVSFEQITSRTIDGDACWMSRHVRYCQHARRYTAAHELAHVATGWTMALDFQGHGPEWRRWYVQLTAVLYGVAYAERLHKTFRDAMLPVVSRLTLGLPGAPQTPLVPLDDLVGVTHGGWRR